MTAAAYARVARADLMPGLIIVPQSSAAGAAIDDLLLLAECSLPIEWVDRVIFLPLS